MPLTRIATDAFGVSTISLVFLTVVLGLLCIFRSLYFQFCIRRRHYPQLSYFNGPWISRIILILVSIWWGFGEIVRLSYLKSRIFSDKSWQKNVCKFYILSNLGFAEPSMFLMLSFLLHAALQKRESSTLSPRWNRKTIGYVLLFCLPILLMQTVLVIFGHRFSNEVNSDKRRKVKKFFACVSSSTDGDSVCMYPLLSTIILGGFYALLICYITYVGIRILSLVINKGLRRRIYVLMASVLFLPLRAVLLGFSVLPQPGNLLYEGIVFLAFFLLLCCAMVGIFMLVYFPVADSLALRDISHVEIEGIPYDDYYYDGASLIANQSHQGVSRNSIESPKHVSISFHSINMDGFQASENINKGRLSHGLNHLCLNHPR
ncbi:hypothetical protein Cni_G23067 [Canna indica]|uniref:Uncharacterized protein n=1 Tax=Canna indica TaxID=4628 RepID=A0AAQ3KVD6_9LILI|nr:hypothetical protein Cni_G23067 [Canna indica]